MGDPPEELEAEPPPLEPAPPAAGTSDAPPAQDSAPPSRSASALALILASVVWVLAGGLPWLQCAEMPVGSHDAGWHLATGRLIYETGTVPQRDPFCSTSGDTDWVNLNYLAELGTYLVYLGGGLGGALAGTVALPFLLTLLLFTAQLRQREVQPMWGLLALAAIAWLVTPWFQLRPRVCSYVLAPLLLLLLGPDKNNEALSWRRIAALVALFVAWCQLHGGFIYGFAILGIDFLASSIQAYRAQDRPFVRTRAFGLGFAGLAGLLLGFALHAHGFDALFHALSYTINVGSMLPHILELMPTYVWVFERRSAPIAVAVGVLLVAVAAGFLARRKTAEPEPLRLRDPLLLAFFTFLALRYVRALPFALLIALPWSAAQLSRRFGSPSAGFLSLAWRRLGAGLVVFALLWGVLRLPRRLDPEVSPRTPGDVLSPFWRASRGLPVRCASWLQSAPQNLRFYNYYHSGGLLTWALYGQRRVFIDGRGDLHNYSGAWTAHVMFSNIEPGWEQSWQRLAPHVALLLRGCKLQGALEERGWKFVTDDPDWVLLADPRFYPQIPAHMRQSPVPR